MALNPSYTHDTTLKKLNINNSIYWLKDADLRAVVEGFGTATGKDFETALTYNSDAYVPTSKAVADYITNAISGITGAMHFMGVVTRTSGQTDAQAIAAFYTSLGKSPSAGDVVIMQDNGKEYIYSGTAWEEVGDQNIYLTIAAAAATYAPLASPALTGTPTAPTAAAGTSTTQIATTAFVANAISLASGDTIVITFDSQTSLSTILDEIDDVDTAGKMPILHYHGTLSAFDGYNLTDPFFLPADKVLVSENPAVYKYRKFIYAYSDELESTTLAVDLTGSTIAYTTLSYNFNYYDLYYDDLEDPEKIADAYTASNNGQAIRLVGLGDIDGQVQAGFIEYTADDHFILETNDGQGIGGVYQTDALTNESSYALISADLLTGTLYQGTDYPYWFIDYVGNRCIQVNNDCQSVFFDYTIDEEDTYGYSFIGVITDDDQPSLLTITLTYSVDEFGEIDPDEVGTWSSTTTPLAGGSNGFTILDIDYQDVSSSDMTAIAAALTGGQNLIVKLTNSDYEDPADDQKVLGDGYYVFIAAPESETDTVYVFRSLAETDTIEVSHYILTITSNGITGEVACELNGSYQLLDIGNNTIESLDQST